jgi:hypothetical protein
MKKQKKSMKAVPKKMAVAIPISKTQSEYDKDFSKWADKQANLIKKGKFSELDIDNLVEEIEDLSKRERDKLISHLEKLLMHKLKVKYQPDMHTTSWDHSIKIHQHKAELTLFENPSLKPKLKNIIKEAYFSARLEASNQTRLPANSFPDDCEWNLREIFPDLEKKYC